MIIRNKLIDRFPHEAYSIHSGVRVVPTYKGACAMSYKKFLVPVGVAVAVLISSGSHAVQTPVETHKIPGDPVLQRLMNQIGAQEHALLLHKPAPGMIYAQHYSHSSHGSHGSHGSHRSGG